MITGLNPTHDRNFLMLANVYLLQTANELHPDHRNREEGSSLSTSWKPLIHILKEGKWFSPRPSDTPCFNFPLYCPHLLGCLYSHASPCNLTLVVPLRATIQPVPTSQERNLYLPVPPVVATFRTLSFFH